jgi:ACS family pantothenate transporter-like MFS transporter
MGGRRYIVAYFIAITGICTSAMILSSFTNTSVVFGAYYWAGAVYACQATFFAWANDELRYAFSLITTAIIIIIMY